MNTLQGKVALVTGGKRGIGKAIVYALAEAGATVAFTDKSSFAAAEEIVKDLNRRGLKGIAYLSDAASAVESARVVESVIKEFGRLDILVNNAGIQHVAPIEEFPIDKWNQIIAINLSAAFHACRAAVPGMKARKWGRIVNTASAHSLVARARVRPVRS